jgi:type I restriction enzyme, S subunit
LPPLSLQRKIGAIVSTYDDLIENNHRRIKLLEEMAQRIYHEWFVNFRYPGYDSAHGPGSERATIPGGWKRQSLGDVVELAYGKALRADARRTGAVPVFGSGGVTGTHDAALVDGPGIVVGRKGNVGSVHWSDEPFFPIDTTYYVRTELPFSYVYFALQDMEFIDSHAAVPGLSRNQAYSLPFVVPTGRVLSAFDEVITPIFVLRHVLDEARVVLRSTRDLLLPRLISGAIDVADLDIAVPEPVA